MYACMLACKGSTSSTLRLLDSFNAPDLQRQAVNPETLLMYRFRVQGLGFRVQGLGFRVQGSGFRVQGLGFRV